MSKFSKGDIVVCTKSCKSTGSAPDIEEGEILVVRGCSITVWFETTSQGAGGYDVCNFEIYSEPQKNGLPAKFFIKRTPETAEVINKWFTENTAIPRTSTNAYLYYPVYRGADNSKAPSEGYVEVSYEQFSAAITIKPIIVNDYSIF